MQRNAHEKDDTGRGPVNSPKGTPASLRPPPWFWLAIAALIFLLQALFGTMGTAPLPYSDFKKLLYAGNVNDLAISDDTVSGTLKTAGLDQVLSKETLQQMKCAAERGCAFTTVRVADPALVEDMEAAGVRFVGQTKSDWLPSLLSWLVPIAFGFWMWSMLAKKSGMSSG